MHTHFDKWGHSLALRIPSAMARELRVSARSKATVEVREGSLVITPDRAVPKYDINKLIARITPENLHVETDTGEPVGNEFS